MFPINKQNIETRLPVILTNYRDILVDEIPILFTGTNYFGNRILGSIIDEDLTNKFTRYLHSIIDDKTYYQFVRKEISYLEVINICQEKYFIDEAFDGITYIFPITISDIPVNYLPTQDSFHPDYTPIGSSIYTVSLKGKSADEHKVEINEINQVHSEFASILDTIYEPLEELNFSTKTKLKPAGIGSFRVNFDIELEYKNSGFFSVDINIVFDYIAKYFEYIVSQLPNTEEANLEEVSPHFKIVEEALQAIYNNTFATIAPIVLEEKLLDNINEAANKFREVSNNIKSSTSFSSIELLSISEDGQEVGIGLIDENYYDAVAAKIEIEDFGEEEEIHIIDTIPKEYRILVYSLNTENGNGKARLYYDNTENYDKVSLHVAKVSGDVKNSIFSNGLNEGKVITIMGIATRINDRYKILKTQV